MWCQVHTITIFMSMLASQNCDGCVEKVGEAEEGGGVADGDHQEGGQKGHQGLESVPHNMT